MGVEGLTYAKAAAAVKRPMPTVYGWCKREGVTPGSRSGKAALDKALPPTTARGKEPKLTADEAVRVIHGINGAVAAAAREVDKFLGGIPPADPAEGPLRASPLPPKEDALPLPRLRPAVPEGVDLPPVKVTVRAPERVDWQEVPGDPAQAMIDEICDAAGMPRDLAPRMLRKRGALPPDDSVCRNCGDRFDGPVRDCPNPSPGKPYVDCGRGGHWFEDPPPESTARREQLEVPEDPPPRHVEVYVGPPRGARVEVLEAQRDAALKVLRDKDTFAGDRIRVAVAILNETGGAS